MAGKYLTMSILPLTLGGPPDNTGHMGQNYAAAGSGLAVTSRPGVSDTASESAPVLSGENRINLGRWRTQAPPRTSRATWAPRTHRHTASRAAWAALLVVWFVWGSTFVAIRVGVESMPPLAMAAVRYLVAGALLLPVARMTGTRALRASDRPGIRQWLGMAVVGTMLLAFGNGAACYAEQTLPAGFTALLIATVPFWMVLADRIINRRAVGWLGWLALAVGAAGVAVLARPHGSGAALPTLIVLGGSLSWGTGSVLAGRLPAPARPLLGSSMEMLSGGAVLAGLAAATGELGRFDPAQVSGRSWLALAYLIVPGSLLAMTCYVIALRRLPTAAVSTYAYVNPVVAVGLGALLLGEHLTPVTLAGGGVVLVSVALLLWRRPG
jgi:drug/metabolite transporter (DMT)-like permease